MNSNIVDQTKLEAFRQNWEQIRHIENLRLSFTNFYALLVVAVIAFVATTHNNEERHIFVFLFLTILSLMGLFLCWRTRKTAYDHRRRALWLVGELTGEKNKEQLKNYIPFEQELSPLYNPFYVRTLYIWLYGLATIIFGLFIFLNWC
ncbi:MAG: hypothetical protein HY530_03350 [Chloroflexi bacterium]|nr:hypothetical protein [Chloroflexota bacterium]